MRFAFADPPYLGCGSLYATHHAEARAWDDPETHRALIARLVSDYPDGWLMGRVVERRRRMKQMLLPFAAE